MKKIMFSDKFGLTDAVLDGRKTMTRRVINMTLHKKNGKEFTPIVPDDIFIACDGMAHFQVGSNDYIVPKQYQPAYHVGDEVAIAQKYQDLCDCDAFYDALAKSDPTFPLECIKDERGCCNKMYVKAQWMPHRIRIIGVKIERLQNISEDDAMCEGVFMYDKVNKHHEFDMFSPWSPSVRPYKHDLDNIKYCCTARAAFSYLINKMMGRGTWESNPWVVAYEFRLLR